MRLKNTLQNIASQNTLNLIEATTLSGGDINEVFLLKCVKGSFVVKLNSASKFPEMFTAEAKGLDLLKNSKSFRIPKVVATGVIKEASYLLMEYIPTGSPKPDFWKIFAQNLVTLHKTTQNSFGLDHDNYIGSLPQQNTYCQTASEFYISERLEPQFRMASDNGFQFKNLEKFYKNIAEKIPNEPPALIHGDLWNGNFMVSEEGNPVLIDPAVAFAPREMDLAMMKLFGGFNPSTFEIYDSVFPLKSGWKNRIDLWQLYYLLVHLNLFGSGYLGQVQSIVLKHT